MPRELDDFSADELLLELRAREDRDLNGGDPERGDREAAAPPDEEPDEDETDLNADLADVETQEIGRVLYDKQKVIYGVDDRRDVFQITDAALLQDADCVVALFEKGNVKDNGDGTSSLVTTSFQAAHGVCNNEPFRKQPVGAFCSGFLVARDVVATAGHCVDPPNTPALADIRFVFGFRMVDANTPPGKIPNGEIYRGAQLIGRQLTQSGIDWALVRLDRPVQNHRPAPVRRRKRIGTGARIHVIGHPVGLPAKFAGGAKVRDNTPSPFFVANLDTYGGNSGSPVFNSKTHKVEGILVRGERDFRQQGNCLVSLVCPTTGCRGEDVTRITKLAAKIPPA
jgi:V8-like Glu-specific endopeptidase